MNQYEQEFRKIQKVDNHFNVLEQEEVSGVKVGDSVTVLNGNECEVGPFKVLGFTNYKSIYGKEELRMYLDWDCYWFPIGVDRVVSKSM